MSEREWEDSPEAEYMLHQMQQDVQDEEEAAKCPSCGVASSVSRALATVGGDRGISKLAGKTGLATL